MQIKLLTTGDIDRQNGRWFRVSGIDEVAQRIRIVLNTARADVHPATNEAIEGAYRFDQELGVRWISILYYAARNPTLAKAILATDLARVRGIVRVASLTMAQDSGGALSWSVTAELRAGDDTALRTIAGSIQ